MPNSSAADPTRTDDTLVNRLLEEVEPRHTVIDVGAGGGRLALALATRCRQVVAVEPSASMADVLRQQASDYSIRNVTLVQSSWESAEVEPGDIVLCSHVLYVVREIESFVRKLESHAKEKVLVVLFQASPQSQTYDLWERIHREKRIPLPSLPELQEVLAQLEVDAKVELLPTQPARGFDDYQQALEQLSRRLYLAEGSPQLAELERILPELLEEVNGALLLRGSESLQPALVSWRPA